MNMILEAREFAREAHQDQSRKGKLIPYFSHVDQVGRTLYNYGFREEVVAAGYLHDVTEDTEYTLEDIEENFGEEIARLVDGASEHDKSASWQERKQHTIDYIQYEAALDEIAIKAADKIDNVGSINQELEYHGQDLWDKFNAPKTEQAWYHHALTGAIEERVGEENELKGDLSAIYRELRKEVNQTF